jgi:hypothetical protein
MTQLHFAFIYALAVSVMITLAMVEPRKVRTADVIAKVIVTMIVGLWLYMAWWGIFLN